MEFIVNTPLVKVFRTNKGIEMHIRCKDGSVIAHEPFQDSLEGMVAAISLSAEICAGKFYLNSIVSKSDEKLELDFKPKNKVR